MRHEINPKPDHTVEPIRAAPRNEPPILVRCATPADVEGLQEMFARLSAETVYRRFHLPYPRVPEWMVEHLLKANGRAGGSLVAVAEGRIVGHALYVRDDRREAEVAIVVEDLWQSRGVGKLLLRRLAAEARLRGVETFIGAVLGENRRALALLDAVFGGVERRVESGSYYVRAPLRTLKPASGRTEYPQAA